MDEVQYKEGRLEALSLIVRVLVNAHKNENLLSLAPPLIHLTNRYFLDEQFDAQHADFQDGFKKEIKETVAILNRVRSSNRVRSENSQPFD